MAKKFRVLIADKMSPKAAEIFGASADVDCDVKTGMTPEELVKVIGEYDGLAVRSATKVKKEILEAASKLKVVGRAGIGVDNIDVKECTSKGILVENTPFGNAITTAEHAISLMMSLARHIPRATASMKQGKWEKKLLEGTELCEKTLGVLGLGNIGKIVANRAQGLHMKVIAFDPVVKKSDADKIGVELISDFDEFCKRGDFFTCHAPLNDKTRGILGSDAFAKMRDGAFVINAARGGIVDESALLKALESGKVAGAALDVFEEEPPPENHPLVMHERVICSPHLGASTKEAQIKVAVQVAEQIVAYLEKGEVINPINPEAAKGS